MSRSGKTKKSSGGEGTKKAIGVGYRRPPEETRFTKGKSGNPEGRPKGSKNTSTYYLTELKRKVPITEDGKRKRITKLEANIKQEVTQGAGGNLKAVNQVLDRALRLEERNRETPLVGGFTDTDREVILAVYQRMIQADQEKCHDE